MCIRDRNSSDTNTTRKLMVRCSAVGRCTTLLTALLLPLPFFLLSFLLAAALAFWIFLSSSSSQAITWHSFSWAASRLASLESASLIGFCLLSNSDLVCSAIILPPCYDPIGRLLLCLSSSSLSLWFNRVSKYVLKREKTSSNPCDVGGSIGGLALISGSSLRRLTKTNRTKRRIQ